MAMSRFSAFGRLKSACLRLSSPSTACLGVASNKELYKAGIARSLFRTYFQYKLPNGANVSHKLHKAQEIFWNRSGSKNFYVLPISRHAQIAWKRLSHICSYNGPALPPISRIACAVSVALTRSPLVAPSVIFFIIGELALADRTLAYAEPLPAGSTLFMHVRDGHIYLISLVFSLLEGLILLFRVIYLSLLFTPSIAMVPFVDSLGIQFRKTWLHVVRHTLERAGPAFIKWGQWAATRPDLFPRDLCTELSKLQTEAPAHNFAVTKKTVEKAFGHKLLEIFEKFEEEPIASGSVAQVHRATLKYRYAGGPAKPIVVAVKVRHPGVGETIKRDFRLIHFVAKISKFIPSLKCLRLDESVQQFAGFMMSQVDLAREAAQLSRFIYNFRNWKDVSFPRPLYPLVHPAVLVETYEHGESVMHYVDKLKGHDRTKSAIAHIGTHALLKMLLVDNFIHADLHPGNILVRPAQSKASPQGFLKSKPHVIFLDVGMTAELSKKNQASLLEFFKAVALRDGRTAAECTLKLSRHQRCPDPKGFVKEVEKSFKFWNTSEGSTLQPAECIQDLLEKVRCHKVNIDGNVCTVLVTTLVLQGWQHKLDPDYNVMQTLQTLLFKVDWAESLIYTIEGLMAP